MLIHIQCNADLRSYSPSQADVISFQGVKEQPSSSKYPSAYRWYKNIASYESEFSSLPGDSTKPYSAYGPAEKEVTLNPKATPTKADAEEEKEEDEEEDLFASDDDEEDAEAVKIREENLAAYKKNKEGKVKPAAKSIVTLDVKPWGELSSFSYTSHNIFDQLTLS